jgi:hypothetical protein
LALVTFAAGVATVGIVYQLGRMASSPLPMINGSKAESDNRARSARSLKHIANSAQFWADGNGRQLPAGYTADPLGRPLHSWATALLPYLEQDQLFAKIDPQQPWNDPINRSALAAEIPLFLNRNLDLARRNNTGFALIHYAGNKHTFPAKRGLRFPEDFQDSTFHTILFGEVSAGFCPWGDPSNLRDPARGLKTSAKTFGGPWSTEITQFAMADGSVRSVRNSVSRKSLLAAATPSGADQTGPDW